MPRWLVVVALVALLGAMLNARSAPGASPRTRSIDSALTLERGHARTLYAVRGIHYGKVGHFLATCTPSGLARTRYVLGKSSPDALVAVDGRGTAGGAKLAAGNRSLVGGSRPSGIELWIVRTGGQPEAIGVDATLLVISAGDGLGHCHFALRGALAITRH